MIIRCFIVVSDGLLTALSLWVFVFQLCMGGPTTTKTKTWLAPSPLCVGYLQTVGVTTRSRGAPLSLDRCQHFDLVAVTSF